jgi:hypothetical protein
MSHDGSWRAACWLSVEIPRFHFEVDDGARVIVVTPETAVTERASGEWLLQFHQPPGAK